MRIEPEKNTSKEETRANIEHFINCVNACRGPVLAIAEAIQVILHDKGMI